MPKDPAELAVLPVFRGRAQRRESDRWSRGAIARARETADTDLLSPRAHDGPPPARSWPSRDPAAAARLTAARAVLAEIAEAHGLPVENLLAPETCAARRGRPRTRRPRTRWPLPSATGAPVTGRSGSRPGPVSEAFAAVPAA